MKKQTGRGRAAGKRRLKEWVKRNNEHHRLFKSLRLSFEQHLDLLSAPYDRPPELMEVFVMLKTGCSFAEARKHVATLTEVPCPGRAQCTGGHVHASQLLEQTVGEREAMRKAI